MPHLRKQERKRTTPVRWQLSRTHAILGRAIPRGCVPMSGIKVRSLAVLSNNSAFHRWSAQIGALLLSSDERRVVRRVQMGVSIWDAVHSHPVNGWELSGANVQALARRARNSVVPYQRSSAGLRWLFATLFPQHPALAIASRLTPLMKTQNSV